MGRDVDLDWTPKAEAFQNEVWGQRERIDGLQHRVDELEAFIRDQLHEIWGRVHTFSEILEDPHYQRQR